MYITAIVSKVSKYIPSSATTAGDQRFNTSMDSFAASDLFRKCCEPSVSGKQLLRHPVVLRRLRPCHSLKVEARALPPCKYNGVALAVSTLLLENPYYNVLTTCSAFISALKHIGSVFQFNKVLYYYLDDDWLSCMSY